MRIASTAAVLSIAAARAFACEVMPDESGPLQASFVNGDAGTDVVRAFYTSPTTEYDHGILGDAIEAADLVVNGADADTCGLRIAAGAGHVFEDAAPRLADLDSDGRTEVIAVRTSVTQGAQLAIYGLRDGDIALLAATPYIGQRNRWLAPIGAGDLDGDGLIELAYIDRPHLARMMRLWRFDGAQLTEAYRIDGLTNHRIGDPAISGGVRTCDGVAETVTASADWSRVIATRIENGKALMQDLGPNRGAESFAAALACSS